MASGFQGFTLASNGLLNVLVTDCGVRATAPVVAAPSPAPAPAPAFQQFKAIWDTGATNCVITPAVAAACGIPVTGMTQTHGVHGTQLCNTYLVDFMLPNGVGARAITVTEGNLGPGADVLIGMDIIANGDFSITNFNGQTVFSFRIPSQGRVDYVEQANALNARGRPAVTRKERREEERAAEKARGRR